MANIGNKAVNVDALKYVKDVIDVSKAGYLEIQNGILSLYTDNTKKKKLASTTIPEVGSGGSSINLSDYYTKLEIDANKTSKRRIDFDGTSFKLNGLTLNYKQLYDYHLTTPDFTFVVYGDRAYLLSYVQDGIGMKEMRFQSVIAVTDSTGISNTKVSGIYVTSSDGVNIASTRIVDINNENNAYKATQITDSNKNDVWYPTTKAVADYVKEHGTTKEELSDIVNEYFEQNPPSGVTPEAIASAVESYLEENPVDSGAVDMVGASVKWNEPMLDIVNAKRLSNAIKLSPDGHLAHNACVTACGGGTFATAWSEDVSGGTADNASSSNVHGKLKFFISPYSTHYKIGGDDICPASNDVTYDIFPVGTVIDGHTVVSDSDHMIVYDNATLRIFGMVKFDDGITRICYTYGSVGKGGTGTNKSVTYVASGTYEIVKLSVDGTVGEYDFSRVDSAWMKTPQINTKPYLDGTTYRFSLSINGKAVAFCSFTQANPTVWSYDNKIDANDIHLEASVCTLSWQSNTTPNKIVAYRTSKGYACIVGMINDTVLHRFYLPASNSRVRLLKIDAYKCILACEDIGRGSVTIYAMNVDLTGHLSNPVQIWHSGNGKITDYLDFVVDSNALVIVGTNGGGKSKGGVSACTMLHLPNRADYSSFKDNLFNTVLNGTSGDSVTDEHINGLIDAKISAIGTAEGGRY